ncbi:MAG: hypothetical protein U0163_05470 [Gemmatimonadaceae bacterium]
MFGYGSFNNGPPYGMRSSTLLLSVPELLRAFAETHSVVLRHPDVARLRNAGPVDHWGQLVA